MLNVHVSHGNLTIKGRVQSKKKNIIRWFLTLNPSLIKTFFVSFTWLLLSSATQKIAVLVLERYTTATHCHVMKVKILKRHLDHFKLLHYFNKNI